MNPSPILFSAAGTPATSGFSGGNPGHVGLLRPQIPAFMAAAYALPCPISSCKKMRERLHRGFLLFNVKKNISGGGAPIVWLWEPVRGRVATTRHMHKQTPFAARAKVGNTTISIERS